MESGIKCPSYLSVEYLKSALEEGFHRNDIKVLNFDVKLANLGGENYCSVIYRIKVDYVLEDSEDTSPKEVHLILKDMRSEVEAEVAKSKETDMYRKVIPEMEKILGGKEILAPKLFKVARFDTEAYIFQDLNALQYELKDRLTGLDEKDCVVVLKKIAKFHAASMVFAEKFPEVMKGIQDHYLTVDSTLLDTHSRGMFESSAAALRKWEGYESIAAKIDKLPIVSRKKCLEVCDRTKCRYLVINHCDLWVNNFLIKDDDLAFIDLQLCCYGSPAIDIQYFLYSSVPLDLLKRKRYEFLRIYFKQFEDTLRDIGYKKIPSWEDFVYEMRRLEFYGIWSLMLILPMVVLSKDESKGTEFNTIKDEKAWAEKKSSIFKVERLEDTFKYAFDRFNDIGALEF